METKLCKKCNDNKILDEFYCKPNGKYENKCKLCVKLCKNIWYITNKNEIKKVQDRYRKNNQQIIKIKAKNYRDSKRIKKPIKIKKEINVDHLKQYQKEWRKNNKNYSKWWSKNNKNKINEYQKKRKNNDPIYKFKS